MKGLTAHIKEFGLKPKATGFKWKENGWRALGRKVERGGDDMIYCILEGSLWLVVDWIGKWKD